MSDEVKNEEKFDDDISSHEYDGIKELNREELLEISGGMGILDTTFFVYRISLALIGGFIKRAASLFAA